MTLSGVVGEFSLDMIELYAEQMDNFNWIKNGNIFDIQWVSSSKTFIY